VAPDMDQWRALVNTVINLRVLSSSTTGGFWRTTELHGVSSLWRVMCACDITGLAMFSPQTDLPDLCRDRDQGSNRDVAPRRRPQDLQVHHTDGVSFTSVISYSSPKHPTKAADSESSKKDDNLLCDLTFLNWNS
jgi:hypothetical protein